MEYALGTRSGTRAAWVLVAVAAALSARAGEPAPRVEPPKAARILPGRTLALFVVEDIGRTKEAYKETSLWKLWEEPETQAFFEPILPRLREIVAKGEEMGEFSFADIGAAFGGQVALAALGVDSTAMPPLPEVALVADIADRAAATRLLARLGRAVREGTPAEFTTWEAGPLTFGRISQPGERMEFGYVLAESALYAALGPDGNALRALVSAARNGQQAPLADAPDFLKAVDRAGGRRDLFGYVNVARVRELAFDLAGKAGQDPAELDLAKRVLDTLGFDSLRSASFVEVVDPPGFRSQVFVHAPSPRKGVFDLVSREPVRESMLKLAPSSAKGIVAFRLRMEKLVPLLRDFARVVDPNAVMQIDAGLEQVKQQLGFDVERGMLGGLGLEGAVISAPVATAGVGPAADLAGLVLVMRAADPESFAPVYEILFALAQAQAGARGWTVAATTTPDGASVTSFEIPFLKPNGIVPAVTMSKGYLVLGLSPEVVARTCRALSGILPVPLVEADDYRQALARVGAEPGWLLSFGRPMSKEGIDGILQYAPMASPLLAGAAGREDVPRELGDLLRAIDLTKLPTGSTIARHGLAQITVGWQDEEGLALTSFGPVGLSAASAAVAGVGTMAAIPQVLRARTMAQRAVCASNLKQIGLALQLYANDNGGSYPARLEDLVPDYVADARVLRCSASGMKYSYVSGLKASDRGNVIVVFEPAGNHGNGTNIARIDGTVIWQPNAEWVRRMVEMQVKRFERQNRAVKVVAPGEAGGGGAGGGAADDGPEEFF